MTSVTFGHVVRDAVNGDGRMISYSSDVILGKPRLRRMNVERRFALVKTIEQIDECIHSRIVTCVERCLRGAAHKMHGVVAHRFERVKPAHFVRIIANAAERRVRMRYVCAEQ